MGFFKDHRNADQRRVKRPSEEGREAERMQRENPDHYVSDSFTDSSSRGGPLGSYDGEMAEGGDSTRGMSSGPASKSPLPTRRPESEGEAGDNVSSEGSQGGSVNASRGAAEEEARRRGPRLVEEPGSGGASAASGDEVDPDVMAG